jgi:hypothetical protein
LAIAGLIEPILAAVENDGIEPVRRIGQYRAARRIAILRATVPSFSSDHRPPSLDATLSIALHASRMSSGGWAVVREGQDFDMTLVSQDRGGLSATARRRMRSPPR